MKNKLFAMGISGVMLVFILAFAACGNGTTDSETTETFANVIDQYPLSSGQGGLTLTARKSDTTGIIYLTVSGTVTAANTADTAWTDIWLSKGNITGEFAAVSIDLKGVFTAANVANILAIRSESQALRYYTGMSPLLSEKPTAPVEFGPTTWIPSDTSQLPVRWKAYAANSIPANDNLTLLIWENASPKSSKLEVTSWTNIANDVATGKTGDIATIIFDYSGVSIE
ncbi:MAG: hypothetical protein LBQ44_01630 [Treponema sp.]|jgi:hypothetical protein|nr:hypothetical protein [Treponema sp.]